MSLKIIREDTFRRLNILTIASVYLLILVGGIVRSTGSGMGCPDWPKCFGSWIPPTEISQLPEDYQQKYSERRNQKNQKLSGYLDLLGFNSLAYKIRKDKSILVEQEFNKSKTWTEYVNRLIGVAIGLFIMASFISSMAFLGKDNRVFYMSLGCLVLVIFQGWLGSVVVSTNLLPGMVTVHMIMAFLIVAILIYLFFRTQKIFSEDQTFHKTPVISVLLMVSIIALLGQIILGTQVRESVDQVIVTLGYDARDRWIGELGLSFYIHRTYSLFILGLNVWILYLVKRNDTLPEWIKVWWNYMVVLIGLGILTGAAMAYFAIPSFIQPIHLLLSTLIFSMQFILMLALNYKPGFQLRTNTIT